MSFLISLRAKVAAVALAWSAALPAQASDEPDLKIMNESPREAHADSEVMATAAHLSDVIGPRLPGFSFIQDPQDFFPRTWHTNLDTLDYVAESDLQQASIIVAAFLYNAAMRNERLPRLPGSHEVRD